VTRNTLDVMQCSSYPQNKKRAKMKKREIERNKRKSTKEKKIDQWTTRMAFAAMKLIT